MLRRIVVTGGRNYKDREFLWSVLDGFLAEGSISLGVGDCHTGADRFALEWKDDRKANGTWISFTLYVAEWNRFGGSAGPRRNTYMLANFKPTDVLVFPGGRGTMDCRNKALKMPGVRVWRYDKENQ